MLSIEISRSFVIIIKDVFHTKTSIPFNYHQSDYLQLNHIQFLFGECFISLLIFSCLLTQNQFLLLNSFLSKDLYNPCFMVLVMMQGCTVCIFLSSVVFSLPLLLLLLIQTFYFHRSNRFLLFKRLPRFHSVVIVQLSQMQVLVLLYIGFVYQDFFYFYSNTTAISRKRYAFYCIQNVAGSLGNAGNNLFRRIHNLSNI